jgi:outer membrane protein TolC
MKPTATVLLWMSSLACAGGAHAQAAAANRVELPSLYVAATNADPRYASLQLQAEQAALRLETIRAEQKPLIVVEGRTQYQTDVPTPPPAPISGVPLFVPPKGTIDAFVRVDQPLYDATIGSRVAVEEAQLAEAQARLRATLFSLRQEVNDAFFTAALLQERTGALAASIADLQARLDETNVRVREGAALQSDAAAVEATLLRRQQEAAEIQASRRAALARLTKLTGRSFDDAVVLALPDVADLVRRTRQELATLSARPEYEQFARSRDSLARQQEALSAQERPRVSAYGRVGYGRPGLNFISESWDVYGLVGLQVQWKASTWGTPSRERELLALQQRIVTADEAAFRQGIERAIENDAANIDRLASVLPMDDRIIALREEVVRSTQVRFLEGVVTASEYLDRTTELLDVRFAQAGHRVELAQAGAKLLTTMGVEVR